MRHSRRRRSMRVSISGAVAVTVLICATTAGSQALLLSAESPATPQTSEANSADHRDEQMRELVEAITVRSLTNDDAPSQTAELIDQPLMRYSDQQRRFPDATVWGWKTDGRPLAISKVERVISPVDGNLGWQYCFVSLSPGLIDASWADAEQWSASQSGVTWRDLPNAPQAHRSEKGRLLQMKGLARQFEAVISNPRLKQKERMRLLPTPILRYSADSHGILDGGIFGFTSKGTNPDTLLMFELQESGNESNWRFAVVGMTGDAATVRHGGTEVWSKKTTSGPGDHDHWIWRVDWDSDSPPESE